MRRISRLAQDHLVWQGLCSMELVEKSTTKSFVYKYCSSCDESRAVKKPESLRYACISQFVPTVATSLTHVSDVSTISRTYFMWRQNGYFKYHQVLILKISNILTRAYSRACLQFQDKQLLFPYTTLIYSFLQQRQCLFTVHYEVNLQIKFILILMFKVQYFF
jgi:hypothetical protein